MKNLLKMPAGYIPPKGKTEFVACMEDILDIYQMPYNTAVQADQPLFPPTPKRESFYKQITKVLTGRGDGPLSQPLADSSPCLSQREGGDREGVLLVILKIAIGGATVTDLNSISRLSRTMFDERLFLCYDNKAEG